MCRGRGWRALANGTAAHAIEMDDVTCESSLHPGAVVIPAALALAEAEGADAAALLGALVLLERGPRGARAALLSLEELLRP